MIFRTGKVSTYRSMFFIIYAFCFILIFVTNLIEERGSMALTAEIVAERNVPLCPVAIPTLILPAVFKQVLIFPTKLFDGPYGGFYPILFMWLLSVVVLGRGWCSWGCFYGGIDEGFSKLRRTSLFKSIKMNPKWRYLSFAVLVTIVFWAFLEMEPVYCEWLCPLKLVTEYSEINSLVTYLQAIIFISLGMGLLIILPLLLKKRTHCGLFCPLGAFQSIVGLINPYRVKIDKTKCTECGKCKRECPLFVITDESMREKSIPITCSRCGKCMDVCPSHAINYSLLGVPFSTDDRKLSKKAALIKPVFTRRIAVGVTRFVEELFDARTMYVFSGILFGAIISGGMVTNALVRIYHLITTGSLLIK
ncbi:4Fe-4S binding protein [candidate division KSB1 bacterium]|nr:4Fe-4S binding protein [candidate division KSB1 bacterium]